MNFTVQLAREKPACTTFNDTPQCLKQCTGTKIRNAVVGINVSEISLKGTSTCKEKQNLTVKNFSDLLYVKTIKI